MPNLKNKFLLGLTGGIGSGKTTVLEMFRKKGATVIDADEIVHSLYATDESLRAALVRYFGKESIGPDGKVNRKYLADIIFESPRQRKKLEELIHPRVRRIIGSEMAKTHQPVTVVDIPLLYESYWADEFDAVLVVNASDQTRLLRLVKRGLDRSDARRRMDAQLPMSVKLRKADFVINNEKDRGFTQKQVDHLWPKLLANSHGG